MNDDLKPIDQPLDNWKASLAKQVPVLYKQYKGKAESHLARSRTRRPSQA